MKQAPDRRHSRFKHVYPIVRIDTPFNQMYPTNTLAVVKVLTSQADAEAEVDRLNALNGGKGCVYLYCKSRLIDPSGDSVIPTTANKFLKTLEGWLGAQSEIMVLFRFSRAAGSKSFEFFTSFTALKNRLLQLEAETCVTAFRQRQLPLRGLVDDDFIRECLSAIRDGAEFLVLETVCRTAGKQSWFHDEAGESHDELRQTLEGLRGKAVAVGLYPPWLEDSPDVITGYVPDSDGTLRMGIY